MPISNEAEWNEWVTKNTDPYGKCCVDVARKVMELLDEETTDDYCTNEIICRAEKAIGEGGITGFMAGCVAQMVSQCHSKGETFRKKWNGNYLKEGQEGKRGVVNPAILTIKV